jgi:DNA-binding CsgD family transcriptional regulator
VTEVEFRRPTDLTDRELDVLALVADGFTIEDIARRLRLGESTVKTHLKRAFRRLGVNSRAHAVAVAFRTGQLR